MANFSISDYGKYVSLQNVSGSGDPADAPGGGIYLFASGSGGSAKLYLQNEGVSSPFDIAGGGTLTVAGDSGADQTINLDSEDITFAGGEGLATVMTDDTVTINLDIDGMSSATTAVVDADLLIIDDGANGTNQKITRGNLLGSAVAAFSNGMTATTMSGSSTLAVGGVATFGASLLPLADGSVDLGSSTKEFKDLYIDGVAYIDSLQADQLGAALDANNQAITNVDINSGAMDGVVIGAASQAAASFTTVSGSSTLAVGGVATFGANVLPLADGGMDLGSSSAEWKDLYIDGVAYVDSLQADQLGAALDANNQAITNVDINSGAIDGTTIGAASQAAGQFTTVSGSGAASFASTVTAQGNVLPLNDNGADLGSSSKEWKDLYIDGVAYIDSLQADALGAALDANNQAITNVNIDSGAIDGVSIGSNSAVTFLTASNALITNLDVVTLNSVSQTETTLEIADKLIVAALSASSANSADGGLKIGGGASSDGHASVLWDHANSALDFNIGGTTEVRLADGVFRPETDNDVDLGASGAEFKDLYLDGSANIDMLKMPDVTSGKLLVADGTSYEEVALSGDATLSNTGALTIAADAVEGSMLNDNVISGQTELAHADIASADELMISDGGTLKKVGLDSLRDHYYGQVSGDATIADGGALTIAAQAVENSMLADDAVGADELAADAVVNASVASNAAIVATKLNFNVDFGGNVQFGSQSDDVVAFGGPIKVGGNVIANSEGESTISMDVDQNVALAAAATVGGGYGSSGVTISSAGAISADGALTIGADGAGVNFKAFGGAANEHMSYDAGNHVLYFVDGSSATLLTLGGDATTEYALDVANGSDNINKVRAAAFVTYSDESLKSDVASMSNTALDTVMSLEGVEFTWKDSGERDFGFIAQDVQSVLPNAVHTAADGVQGVDYSRLTSVLVEAVKAQQVQIDDLKKVITNLKK